eukprot:12493467-Alexandrium_andersonii.AAC.1
MEGQHTLAAWNEVEEAFGAQQGWRSFAASVDPAGWLEPETYTEDWFAKGNLAIRAYYLCRSIRGGREPCSSMTRADKWIGIQP